MTSADYKKAFDIQEVNQESVGEASVKPSTAPETQTSKAEKALDIALDVRKFEIGLYWTRAAYFWTFIGISFAAYGTELDSKDKYPKKAEMLLVISCIGLVFSLAWYFVNRASKFWQENWEKHVDLLEDGVIGPLYKTVIRDKKINGWRLLGPYPFSVSKINQILSLFVTALFLVAAIGSLFLGHLRVVVSFCWFAVATFAFTGGFIWLLVRCGKTDSIDPNPDRNPNIVAHGRSAHLRDPEARRP